MMTISHILSLRFWFMCFFSLLQIFLRLWYVFIFYRLYGFSIALFSYYWVEVRELRNWERVVKIILNFLHWWFSINYTIWKFFLIKSFIFEVFFRGFKHFLRRFTNFCFLFWISSHLFFCFGWKFLFLNSLFNTVYEYTPYFLL